MATRKVKHAEALARRELFFQTVHQGNQDWLKTAQTQRLEEQKKAEEQRKERAIAKSKRLAAAHKAKPSSPKKT
jgi:hypothetical protein